MIQVDVELKRIQTFLFQVPKLKAMLGANAMVGEIMRVKLAELARPLTVGLQGNFGFKADPDDPLNDLSNQHIKDLRDDPADAYSQGILARDGGHFSALFETDENAEHFIKKSEALISSELPGVLFELRKKNFGERVESNKQVSSALTVESILDIPVLQICTATGQGPATEKVKDKEYLSKSAHLREQNGDKFYQGKTRDIIGLLKEPLGLNLKNNPDDLNDLADGGYLALIHADGNSIGNRYSQWKAQCKSTDPLTKEAHGEKFFYSMRVVVRKAVVKAIKNTFSNHPGSSGKRLYQPLMLGGDDLVMVCRADLALEFCRQLCDSIKEFHLADGQPLTLGLGVAIAKAGYPFYRLNELAEELAGSAKRLAHGQDESKKTSVIDWQVVTQSNFNGLATTRCKADFMRYRIKDAAVESLILNQRPYQVLSNSVDKKDLTSLANLLDAAKSLLDAAKSLSDTEGAARSALRGLRGEYEKGRLHGELAFANLINDNQDALFNVGIREAWDQQDDEEKKNGYYSTPLFDLIELTELQHLGNRKSQ